MTSDTQPPSSATPTSPTRGGEAWWRRATIYQIWPRSFADADGDGVGDLSGIIGRLDHLVALGVDAVWISPFYESPMDDAGYDISDYRSIDPLFGTLDQFDELVRELHRRDLRLIVDIVVNHTSDEHPWFVDSRSSLDSPKRHWYWWRPPRAGMVGGEPGAEPNNWGSVFGGSAWEWDESTGEYFLHLFSRKQPDLNWEHPDVRAAVHEMMRWWIDRGVDGFRLDVINFISKYVALPDGITAEGTTYANGMPHFVDGPRIHEFLQELRREVAPDRDDVVWVGEMPGVTLAEAVRYTDPAQREVDMVFQFEHVGVDHGPGGRFDARPLALADLKSSLGRWQAGLDETGWNSLYWCNHDQPRVVSRFGDDGEFRVRSAKMLATVLHLHRGTPFVYQGEELGMTNFPFTDLDDVRDIETVNYVANARAIGRSDDDILPAVNAGARDHARTPMQWDASPAAGFTSGEPWTKVNPDHESVNAAAQLDDDESVFQHYRRLIELRHRLPVVTDGDFTMLLADSDDVYAFVRDDGRDALLVLANVSDATVTVDLAAEPWHDAELLVTNLSSDARPATVDADLAPWEVRAYRRPSVV
jgi:oligo-1,6-glucosidase